MPRQEKKKFYNGTGSSKGTLASPFAQRRTMKPMLSYFMKHLHLFFTVSCSIFFGYAETIRLAYCLKE